MRQPEGLGTRLALIALIATLTCAWVASPIACSQYRSATEKEDGAGTKKQGTSAKEVQALRNRVAELESELRRKGSGSPWKIVNFHDHVYRMDHAEKYVAAARATGISKTVLVGSPKYTIFGKGASKTEGYEENFQEILRIARRWPDLFIPFSSIDPGSADKLETLKRHRALGAQGLKLYNGHSHFYVKEDGLLPAGMDDVLHYLVAEKMPLLWHVRLSSYAKEFEDKVLKQYPDLTVIVAHYGVAFWRPKGKVFADIPRLLDTYPNLYFDTSLGTRKILVDGLALMGRHKDRFREVMIKYPGRFVMGTDMVITGNPEKTVSWMTQVIWACRDQLEKAEFTFDLAARWSKYKPKRGANSDGRMTGLSLPAEVLEQIYVTTPAKLLGWTATPPPATAPADALPPATATKPAAAATLEGPPATSPAGGGPGG